MLVREEIKEKIIIPGETTINFIRETRFTEKIVNSGRGVNYIKNNEEEE